MKRGSITCVMGLCVLLFASLSAAGENTGVGVDVTYATQYVWRGMPLNDEGVVQPSVTITDGGLELVVWGNVDATDWGETEGGYGDETGNLTEVDYVASYTHELGPVALTGGFAAYTFPNTGWLSTTEVFAAIGVDVPASPTLTYNMDVDVEGSESAGYLGFDLSHSFPLYETDGFSLELGLGGHVGYASRAYLNQYYAGPEDLGTDEDKWHDWSASVSLPVNLSGGFYVTPAFAYSSLIDEDLRDEVELAWDREPENGVFTVSLGWAGGE